VGVLNTRVGEGTSIAQDGGKFFGKLIEWRVITEQHNIEDMMELRVALEGVTAANAARKSDSNSLVKLKDLLSKMEISIDHEARFAEHDFEFHLTIAASSGNLLIVDLLTMIRKQMEKTLHRVLLLPNARPLSLKEHTAVFNGIKRQDSDAARRAMQAHLEAAMERYHTTLANERKGRPRRLFS
jgi:GntR family transcriptional repressor for pyruvate dehydrogenase complex